VTRENTAVLTEKRMQLSMTH